MQPLIYAAAAVVALIAGALLGALIARGRIQRGLERIAADQQRTVGLYLRRKVAETAVDVDAMPSEPDAMEVLAAHQRMAEALLERERRQVELGDTQDVSLAHTLRLSSDDVQSSLDGQNEGEPPGGDAVASTPPPDGSQGDPYPTKS